MSFRLCAPPLLSSRFQDGEAFPLSLVPVAVDHPIGDPPRFRIGGAGAVRAPKRRGRQRPLLIIHGLPLVPDHQFPVGPFQNVHPEAGVAGPFRSWQQLQDPLVALHRVVPGHLPGVLDADDLGQQQLRRHQSVGRLRLLRRDREFSVKPWQKLLEDLLSLVDGAGVGQTQLDYRPVLEGFQHPLHL